MLKILILNKDDIDVKPCGFNAFLVHNDEFELIVDLEAVPKLIEQLTAWQSEQDVEERENYLRAKFGSDLDGSS